VSWPAGQLRVILPLLALSAAPLAAQTNVQTNSEPFFRFHNPTNACVGPERGEELSINVNEIRFGWFGPSNPEDPLGGQMWWAADLAIREANDQGGFGGRPFRLIPKWSDNPWGNGVPQVFRMVYEDKVWALLGGIDGASTHLAEQVVAKACLPLVSPVSTDKSVNLAGVPWTFSCAPNDGAIASPLAEAVLENLNGTQGKLVVLSAIDHDSRMSAREIVKALSERHRAPDYRLEFGPATKLAEPQLSSLVAARPRAVVVIAGPEDSARWVTAIRQPLMDATIFGTHHMGRSRFFELAGEAAEGVRFPVLWRPDESDSATRRFTASFKARFGHAPDYAAALSFDATRLLIAATCQGGLNRARIRESLVRLSPWQGISGQIQLDANGQNVRPASVMGTIKNGQLAP
jgi:branched-chain amino acid transport system substrate-binding protein